MPDEEITRFWDSMIAKYPEKDLPRLYRGISYERSGMLEEARLAYAEALKANPENKKASYRLGGVDIMRGDITEGTAMLKKCLQGDSSLKNEVKEYCLKSAFNMTASHCYETAICLFSLLQEFCTEDSLLQARLGDLLETVHDLEAARTYYRGLLMKDPDSSVIAARMDNLLAYSGVETLSRIEEWAYLAQNHPGSVTVLLHLGRNLLDAGDIDRAESTFRKALESDPLLPETSRYLGIVKIRRGEVNAGIQMVQDAATKDPEQRHATSRQLGALATDRARAKEYETALRLYEAALAISPEDLWPKVGLGELMEIMGNLKEALRHYREVLMVAPESPVTAMNMDRLLRGMANGRTIALDEWRVIADRQPGAAVPALYLGISLEALNDREGALAAYRRALEVNPGLVEALRRRDALESKGLKQ